VNTPAALIRKGTHIDQQVVKGSLETLAALVKLHNIKPPSLIVIGEVINTFADVQLKNIGYLAPN